MMMMLIWPLAEIGEWIVNLIPRLLNIVWSILCMPVYTIMSVCYNAFIALPQLDILSTGDLEDIYQRITMIIIIIMAFYITFEIVKYVVQPDTITNKEKGAGNLTMRIAVVILLIAFVPDIFSLAYELQARIVKSDVISKVILGTENTEEDDTFMTTAGSDFAADVFGLFYGINTNACPVDENGKVDQSNAICKGAQDTVDTTLSLLKNYPFGVGRLTQLISLVGTFVEVEVDSDGDGTKDSTESVIEFSGLFALGVGIYVTWTLLVYGVELAKRYFQLIFLQIISPIAIISYLSPKKDGTFQKWIKQCITTYLDLFIRLALINFILLILGKLNDVFFNSNSVLKNIFGTFSLVGYNPIVLVLLYVLLIIGLLNFAKKAPKMLSELMPSGNAASGSYGMSGKEAIDSVKSIVGGASRTIGGTYGAFIGARTAIKSEDLAKSANKHDRKWSALKGAFAGAKAGYSKGGGTKKAGAAARGSVYKDEAIVKKQGTVLGHDLRGGYYAQKAHRYEEEEKRLGTVAKVKDDVAKEASGHKLMKYATSHENDLHNRQIGDADSRGAWKKAMEKSLFQFSVTGDTTDVTNAITDATKTLYDTQRRKIESEASAKSSPLEQELNTATTENQNANAIIDRYANFTEPLTETQQQELNNAQKVKTETDAKIQSATQQLEEIEKNKQVELNKIAQEEIDTTRIALGKITDSTGQVVDGDVLARMSNIFTQGFRDSSGTYVTPSDPNNPITIMTDQEEEAAAQNLASSTGMDIVDARKQVHAQNMQAYVKNIGDIQESANKTISDMSIDLEVQKAKANSNDSEKSGK